MIVKASGHDLLIQSSNTLKAKLVSRFTDEAFSRYQIIASEKTHPTGTAAVSWVAMAWKALEEADLDVSSRAMGWPSSPDSRTAISMGI